MERSASAVESSGEAMDRFAGAVERSEGLREYSSELVERLRGALKRSLAAPERSATRAKRSGGLWKKAAGLETRAGPHRRVARRVRMLEAVDALGYLLEFVLEIVAGLWDFVRRDRR